MITVKNLSFSYSQLPFIENMNFQVRSGEIFGFLGPSGAGKSTLQKILIGMLPKYKGSVSINNIMKLETSLTSSMRVLVSILNSLVFMRNSPHWRT